jgi:predicted permease
MTDLMEVRRAARALVARPWFAIGAVVSLAFGIGANTAVFTLVNAIVFRPLPYPAAHQLMFVRVENPRSGVENGAVSLAELDLIRRHARSLAGAGVVRETDFNVTIDERARRVRGAVVSAATLRTLGVVPAQGTMFVAGDDDIAAPARAVVSERFWRVTLGGAVDVLGRSLRIDGVPFEVIGVMPPGFGFPDQSDLWITLGPAASTAARTPSLDTRVFRVVARLTAPAQAPAAREQLRAVSRGADERRPSSERGWRLVAVSAEAERGENARPAVYLLFALVTSVLLVACANLATLVAARATARQRELAIRSALGASRSRLVWHGLGESIILAAAGALLSLVIAAGGVRLVRLAFPVGTLPYWLRFDVDWRVMLYALGLAIVSMLALGLGPAAWSASRAPVAGLMNGSRSVTSSRGSGRLAGALIAGQLAISLVLVVTASLLVVALRSMATSALGYEPDGLVTTDVEPRARRYVADDAARGTLYATLATNVRAIPGVASVTGFELWGNALVELSSGAGSTARRIDGPVYSVLPGYFETLGVRVITGRSFGGAAEGAAGFAVVNETFARRHWPNESALGRQVRMVRADRGAPWLTVVGVVADVRRNPADLEWEPHVYVSALAFPPRRLRLVARAQPAAITVAALERAARAADPDEPIGPPVTMRAQIAEWTAPSRFFAGSLAGFAVVALIIAVTGVVGVVAGAVVTRTRELGIRMALGATPGEMVRLAVGRAARLSAVGLAVGLLVSLGVARVLVTLPFGVERIDTGVVVAAPLVFAIIALVAAWMPARRAGRIAPTIALSHDP